MVEPGDRDEITQRVAINLAAMIAEKGWTNADLRAKVGKATTTAIYDFLSPKARSRSIKVETLAKWAEALDAPIILFFVEPDRRTPLRQLLGKIDSLGPEQLALLEAVARTIGESPNR